MVKSRGGTAADHSAWQHLEYVYDANGNVTSIFDDENSDQFQCFTYDGVDRLTTAFTDNTSACDGYAATGVGNYDDVYTYSLGGNLKTKTGTGAGTHNGTYRYQDPDHRHAVTETTDGSSFSYDDNGNMVERDLVGNPDQTLTWDSEQQLEAVQIAGGSATTFLYDADGKRVRRQTGSVTSFYTPAGSEYTTTAGTGSFRHYYSHAGATVAYNDNGNLTWMWVDQISSTSLTRTVAGTNGCTGQNLAELNPEFTQGFVDFTQGAADVATAGIDEDLRDAAFSEYYVNEQSGAYAWGGVAAIPVAVYGDIISPGRMLALEGLNGVVDCSQQLMSGDCAEAAVGVGLSGATTVAARNSTAFANSLPESNLEWMHHAMSARMSDTYLEAVAQTTERWSRGLGGAVGSAAESVVNWIS